MFVTLEMVLKEKEKKYFLLFCLLFGLRQTLSPWVIWDCHLQIGTCHGHLPSTYLPLWGLNHVLLQLLTFNTPWKEFRVENRNEALCAQGKAGRTGLQMVRYFQEPILWAQFWYLLICIKALKSFMVMTVPHDQKSFRKLIESFWKNIGLIAYILPSPKSHIHWPFPPASLEQFLRATWDGFSQAATLILPPIKLNSNSHIVFFFFWVYRRSQLSDPALVFLWANPFACSFPLNVFFFLISQDAIDIHLCCKSTRFYFSSQNVLELYSVKEGEGSKQCFMPFPQLQVFSSLIFYW